MMTPKDGYCQSDVDPYITSTLYILVRSNIATISMEFHTGACTAVLLQQARSLSSRLMNKHDSWIHQLQLRRQ